MTLALLFVPSFWPYEDAYVKRVTDVYKKRFKEAQKEEPKPEPEPTPTPNDTREKAADSTLPASPPKEDGKRARYLSYLKEEIKALNDKLDLLEKLKGVLAKDRYRQRANRLESARHALDLELIQAMEDEFLAMHLKHAFLLLV